MTASVVWPLAAATAAFNVPFGRLRAGAPRRSSRWFGVYAAAVFLVVAMRRAFDVTGVEIVALVGAMYLGQWLGRRVAGDDVAPSPLRWRTATYAALLAGMLLVIGQPAVAHAAFTLTSQDGMRVALPNLSGRERQESGRSLNPACAGDGASVRYVSLEGASRRATPTW